jgi:hypothetical protein
MFMLSVQPSTVWERVSFVNDGFSCLMTARGHLFRPPQADACPCARILRALYLATEVLRVSAPAPFDWREKLFSQQWGVPLFMTRNRADFSRGSGRSEAARPRGSAVLSCPPKRLTVSVTAPFDCCEKTCFKN